MTRILAILSPQNTQNTQKAIRRCAAACALYSVSYQMFGRASARTNRSVYSVCSVDFKRFWQLPLLFLAVFLAGCASTPYLTGTEAQAVRETAYRALPDGTFQANATISRFGKDLACITISRPSPQTGLLTATAITPAGAALFHANGTTCDNGRVAFSPLVPSIAQNHLLFLIYDDLYNIYGPPQNASQFQDDGERLAFTEQRHTETVQWIFSGNPPRLARKRASWAGFPIWTALYDSSGKIQYTRHFRFLHITLSPLAQ